MIFSLSQADTTPSVTYQMAVALTPTLRMVMET
jgi:hypothetical protein